MRPHQVRHGAIGSWLCLVFCATLASAAPGYQYFVTGNPADVVTPTSGLLVLQGGGTDVDENFVQMGARSGGGDLPCHRWSPVARPGSSRTVRRPTRPYLPGCSPDHAVEELGSGMELRALKGGVVEHGGVQEPVPVVDPP